MLHVLLESGPRRTERGGGWTLASVLMHATLIGSAVALTARGIEVGPNDPRPPGILYVAPSPPPQVEDQRQSSDPYAPAVPVDGPRIPIPPVPWVDPAPGIPTGPLTGIEEFGSHVTTPGTSEALPTNGIYSDRAVDRIVVPRNDNPRPEYPRSLRSAASEGEVLVTFVVDTSGRVELSSIRIVRETHALFGESVRRWLARTRYIPAEVNGGRVRQLVQQQVGFTLER